MRSFYVTKKQVNTFIENSLKRFDSIKSFKHEVEKVILELDESSPAQLKFYKRVKEAL